jgi:hypothetical protein
VAAGGHIAADSISFPVLPAPGKEVSSFISKLPYNMALHLRSLEACCIMITVVLLCIKQDLQAALHRKSDLCIPFLGIARPQPQFPHSCVCELFI